MCGNFGQIPGDLKEWRNDLRIPSGGKITEWEDDDWNNIPAPDHSPIAKSERIGIGNYAGIVSDCPTNYKIYWSKFGSTRFNKFGKINLFNKQIEKIIGYHNFSSYEKVQGKILAAQKKNEEPKLSYTDYIHLDVQERPCVIFVNHFFENNKKNKKEYFVLAKESGEMIPLAGFYMIQDGRPAFTIITKAPYRAVGSTGHERSPVILNPDVIDDYLDPSIPFLDKKDAIFQESSEPYIIRPVDMTKTKSEKVIHPIGESYVLPLC